MKSLRLRWILASAGVIGAAMTLVAASAGAGVPAAPPPYAPGAPVWMTNAPNGQVIDIAPPVPVIVTPVRPYQFGDKVWTSDATVPAPSLPDANGCQRVPSSGYIGHDVYARTAAEYANYWSWSASSSNESFSWYIQRNSDDFIKAHGTSPGGGGSQQVAANIDYWHVQNTGADPQAWTVCYQVI